MPQYLQPPLIQVGLYWHDRPEIDSMREVLRWLLEHGYNMHPTATAMRAIDGGLPRFDQMATHGLPANQITQFHGWGAIDAMSSTEWLPASLRLLPSNENNIEIDLEYGMLLADSYKNGEPHAIEFRASAEAPNLLENSSESELPPKIVARAKKTLRWEQRIVRQIIEELQPDYGGHFWESDLQPPTSLVACDSISWYSGLILTEKVIEPDVLLANFEKFDNWTCTRFENAVLLLCTDWSGKYTEAGVDYIREVIRKRFL